MNIQSEDLRALQRVYEENYCRKVAVNTGLKCKHDGTNYSTMKGKPLYRIDCVPLPVSDLQPALQKNEPAMRAFYQACNKHYHITKEMRDAYEAVVNGFDQDLLKRLTS